MENKLKKEKLILLEDLKRKICLTAGHTFAAYGFFCAGNFEIADDFATESKKSFEELVNYMDKLISDEN